MNTDQIVGLLLGPLGLLVGSLLLNYLQAKGVLLSRHVVPRDQYDRVVAVNEGFQTKFGEQTDAIKTVAAAFQALLDDPPPRRASRSRRP